MADLKDSIKKGESCEENFLGVNLVLVIEGDCCGACCHCNQKENDYALLCIY